jgi:hypothetical protein
MAYLKNSVLNFTNRVIENTSIEDYFTFNAKHIHEFIDTCTKDYFDYYQMQDDDKIERIALELYENPNYWDILLMINGRDALFDMPYNFGTLYEISLSNVNKYAEKFSGLSALPADHIEYMRVTYEEDIREKNEINRVLKIVKPEHMQDFIREAYENGCFV